MRHGDPGRMVETEVTACAKALGQEWSVCRDPGDPWVLSFLSQQCDKGSGNRIGQVKVRERRRLLWGLTSQKIDVEGTEAAAGGPQGPVGSRAGEAFLSQEGGLGRERT